MSPPRIPEDVWRSSAWVERTRELLDSYRRFVGRELIERAGDAIEDARRLFEAPRVVVAHGTEADPILNYGNRAAANLWEIDLAELLRMPSRLTAEPARRDERARMLARVAEHGFIDDYAGVRIAATGRRFRIEQAIVWNVVAADGSPAGQAATFDRWSEMENAECGMRSAE
jgi:hypothetical protein